MKTNWNSLFVSFVIGVVLTLITVFTVMVAKGFSTWGALRLFSDAEVRDLIRDSGVHLPPCAHDLYFAYAGFVDKTIWMKLTVPKDQVWSVVEDSIEKSASEFAPGIPKDFIKEIWQGKDQELDLAWWNPQAVKSPKGWSRHSESNGQHFFEDWVVDEETGTIYVTKWDT